VLVEGESDCHTLWFHGIPAVGMASDFATYLIRSLLSEGCLRHGTVEKTKDGLVPRLIEREGG
jgi:hypothetical protein